MPSFTSFINQALTQASDIARSNFGHVSSTTKPEDNNQVLTQTDLDIGHAIISHIQSSYPDHNIIDEEAGVIDHGSEYTWVVDPIDGTSNFANGVPTYGIMLGLLKGNIPIAGGIALPSFNQICLAEKGSGAFCNSTPMKVTSQTQLSKCLVAYGIDGHQANPESTRQETRLLAEIILNIRNLRSSNSVFDAVMVAQGGYGAFLIRSSKIWDNVAQQVILEEAGATYTDFFGHPLDYSQPLTKAGQNFTFCAAAPLIHQQLQQIIHSVSSP